MSSFKIFAVQNWKLCNLFYFECKDSMHTQIVYFEYGLIGDYKLLLIYPPTIVYFIFEGFNFLTNA